MTTLQNINESLFHTLSPCSVGLDATTNSGLSQWSTPPKKNSIVVPDLCLESPAKSSIYRSSAEKSSSKSEGNKSMYLHQIYTRLKLSLKSLYTYNPPIKQRYTESNYLSNYLSIYLSIYLVKINSTCTRCDCMPLSTFALWANCLSHLTQGPCRMYCVQVLYTTGITMYCMYTCTLTPSLRLLKNSIVFKHSGNQKK